MKKNYCIISGHFVKTYTIVSDRWFIYVFLCLNRKEAKND